jgi:hypothetical protein
VGGGDAAVTEAGGDAAITEAGMVVVADSVNEYSGTQGQSNWYYGYFAPATSMAFLMMTHFDVDTWHVLDGTYWTRLDKMGGHPNGTTTCCNRQPVEQWAVRRWVSTVAGSVTISGDLASIDPNSWNGIIGHIIVDGVEVWSRVTTPQTVTTAYQITASLRVGSTVDFAIDPNQGQDYSDATRFTIVIAR